MWGGGALMLALQNNRDDDDDDECLSITLQGFFIVTLYNLLCDK